ncbi:SitI3 family protein [Amycolatopsis orientalis]|uniref:SitI3 family protein n=1 Tax=Amycolatopsis orientalis TaxID=31958 RepID=UPI0003A8B18D|nr:SitI3 family protein [Amycolatopsis orientalis]
MSLDYSLDLTTGLAPEEVAEEIVKTGRPLGILEESVTAQQLLAWSTTTRQTWLQVSPARPQPWHPPISELGAITPTVQLLFELNKNDQIAEQQNDLILLTAALLQRIRGDAVFSNLDVVWLVRKNGTLDIHEDNDFWTPERIALLPRPYTRHSHRYE